MPSSGASTRITHRRAFLGDKGANQAVGLAQLGVRVSLIGVVGDDSAPPRWCCGRPARDGIDVAGVTRRGTTALFIDLIDEPASRRLFEHIPADARITVEDLDRAAPMLDAADTVSIQLQHPSDTALATARRALSRGALVVADGRPERGIHEELLRSLHAIRSAADEAESIAEPITTVAEATTLANRLLARPIPRPARNTQSR
jgi:ribokinase